jgi:4-amino-4-deoxy-L-arabinose transferase-like glycosyltransferase
LYTEIWNDQPPVHTMILSAAFRVWGPSILTARLVASAFGILLLATFYQLVRQRSSLWCGLVGAFLLLTSPVVLVLSASAMLEVPAIATALLSVWLIRRWCEQPRWWWVLASGALMGAALQVKLTAAVVAPAVLAEIALLSLATRGSSWRQAALLDTLRWGAAFGAAFLAIGLTWGSGSLLSSLKSHFAEQPVAGLLSPADFPFDGRLLVRHAECVLAAAAGLVLAFRQRRWREFAFPVVLLLTVSLIHALHKPWWNYYYLHFAVPLAWLAGFAVVQAVGGASRLIAARGFAFRSRAAWQSAGLCALAAVVLVWSETRLEAGVREMRRSPKTNGNAILAKMRHYGPRTHWVCAEPVIYPFHAQLPVPPEIAVVMAKRHWSHQISPAETLAVCQRYHPEQILLPNATGMTPEWREFLEAGYTVCLADKESVLYIAKSLAAAER